MKKIAFVIMLLLMAAITKGVDRMAQINDKGLPKPAYRSGKAAGGLASSTTGSAGVKGDRTKDDNSTPVWDMLKKAQEDRLRKAMGMAPSNDIVPVPAAVKDLIGGSEPMAPSGASDMTPGMGGNDLVRNARDEKMRQLLGMPSTNTTLPPYVAALTSEPAYNPPLNQSNGMFYGQGPTHPEWKPATPPIRLLGGGVKSGAGVNGFVMQGRGSGGGGGGGGGFGSRYRGGGGGGGGWTDYSNQNIPDWLKYAMGLDVWNIE